MRHPRPALVVRVDHPHEGPVGDVADAAGRDDQVRTGQLPALSLGGVVLLQIGVHRVVDETGRERVREGGPRGVQAHEPDPARVGPRPDQLLVTGQQRVTVRCVDVPVAVPSVQFRHTCVTFQQSRVDTVGTTDVQDVGT